MVGCQKVLDGLVELCDCVGAPECHCLVMEGVTKFVEGPGKNWIELDCLPVVHDSLIEFTLAVECYPEVEVSHGEFRSEFNNLPIVLYSLVEFRRTLTVKGDPKVVVVKGVLTFCIILILKLNTRSLWSRLLNLNLIAIFRWFPGVFIFFITAEKKSQHRNKSRDYGHFSLHCLSPFAV